MANSCVTLDCQSRSYMDLPIQFASSSFMSTSILAAQILGSEHNCEIFQNSKNEKNEDVAAPIVADSKYSISEFSLSGINEAFVQYVAFSITSHLSSCLPRLVDIQLPSNKFYLSKPGELMVNQIKHFISYVGKYAKLTNAELSHFYILTTRMLAEESELIRQGGKSIVSEANLGTLLLCAITITTKMERDIPFTNSWWAKQLGVPLSILNQSEVIFLKKINFNCNVTQEEYEILYWNFISDVHCSCWS
ncbi:uncharacterized protein MONOS_18533 [Monocercomonoides exilis]|uniref:uncharacterized protein n=1 Tax=Monocercomonoides exilis TaxID=2049356 RepID=UPI003559D3DC|nr:hypothetical protein MONOS_18533 [Monocercomonoides exilis]